MPSLPAKPDLRPEAPPDLIGAAVTFWLGIAALVVTVFIFAVPPTPFEALDYRSILLPYLGYYHQTLAAGEFPFWNPYASLGRPFAADPQAIVFWPPTLVYLGLDAFWGAIVLAWLHAWLAAWSSAKLCLRLGAQRVPALLSGLVFLLSGKIVGHYQAGHLQFVFTYLYLPLLLHAGLLVQEKPGRRTIAWLAALTGWQLLAGAPQVYWSCAVALALFLAGRRLSEPLSALGRGWWADGWRVAAAYALGLALAAVLLVPLGELIGESNRAVARPEFIAIGSMDWLHWASVLTPWTKQGYVVDWEILIYPGVAVTLLGLAGLTRTGDRTVRALWLLLLGTCVLAAGSHTPLFQALIDWLPGYASFRVHGRMGAIIVYALILSATLLVSAPPRRQLVRLGVSALLCLSGLLVLAWHGQAGIVRPLLYLAAAGAAAALWVLAADSRYRLIGGLLLAGGLLADLLITDVSLKNIFRTAKDFSAETPLVEVLRETGRLTPGRPPPRVFAPPDHVRGNAGMVFGFGTFAGSEALALQRVWNYVHWAVGREPPTYSDLYAYNFFEEKGPFPVPWVAQSAVVDMRAGRVEVTPLDPPRAWLVGRTRVVADWREAAGRLAAGHDARQSVLLEAPLPGAVDVAPAAADGSVKWVRFAVNQLQLAVQAPAAGVLVLSEAWYPGWRASVNGFPAAVFPANGWMRGVVVPAGASLVEFHYRPNHFGLGAGVSLLALLGLAWLGRPTGKTGGASAPNRQKD